MSIWCDKCGEYEDSYSEHKCLPQWDGYIEEQTEEMITTVYANDEMEAAEKIVEYRNDEHDYTQKNINVIVFKKDGAKIKYTVYVEPMIEYLAIKGK